MTTRWARTARFIASATLAALCATAAHAHVFPQKQTPGPGATVETPAKVTITFDGPLEPAFSSLNVTDAGGKQMNTAKSSVDPQQPSVETLALPALPAGKYTVHWVAVADDGHRTHGDYAFNVK